MLLFHFLLEYCNKAMQNFCWSTRHSINNVPDTMDASPSKKQMEAEERSASSAYREASQITMASVYWMSLNELCNYVVKFKQAMQQ